MKKCPYCGKAIKDKAIRCVHCNKWIPKYRIKYLLQRGSWETEISKEELELMEGLNSLKESESENKDLERHPWLKYMITRETYIFLGLISVVIIFVYLGLIMDGTIGRADVPFVLILFVIWMVLLVLFRTLVM